MKSLSVVVKVCLSVGILTWVVMQGSWEDLYHALQGFTFGTLALVGVLEFSALFVAALRWKLLLPAHGVWVLFRYTLVGQFYGLVLPGQLAGDVMKTIRLSYGAREDGARVTSSVALDKINGFLGVVVMLCIGVVYGTSSYAEMYTIPALIFGVGLIMLLLVGVYTPAHDWVLRLLRRVADRYPSIDVWCIRCETLIRTYALQVRQWRTAGTNLLLGCVYQVLSIGITMVCAHALGISVGFFDWCWIFGIISLAVALPITVAGIGVREGLFVYYLVGLGVGYTVALALSVSILAIQAIAALSGGLCELWSIHSTNQTIRQG